MSEARQAIPALSIRQPWAELILLERKTIELRTWISDYRGPVWIHTGQSADDLLEQRFGLAELFHGGFVGQVVLQAIVPLDSERWDLWQGQHLDPGEYRPGLYAWIVTSPRRIHPAIAANGTTGLFTPDEAVTAQLLASLTERPQ